MTFGTSTQWFEILRKEYLHDFIRNGGSSVKFLIPSKGTDSKELIQQVRVVAEQEGFHFAFADAAQTRIHMIDRLFNEIARQIDWEALASKFLIRIVEKNGYKVAETSKFKFKETAALNEREEIHFLKDIKQWLEKEIYRDYGMSQEFRIAMMQLCLAQLEDGAPSSYNDLIKQWLYGDLPRISILKEALIFQKITRGNGRYILYSLIHWLRRNEYPGMVIVLDISQYLVAKRPKISDGTLYYSRSAVTDVYELLRQFIDGTDEVDGLLIVVIAPVEFLNDDRRGIDKYLPLKFRISDEVHDRRIQNPLAALNRISPNAGGN